MMKQYFVDFKGVKTVWYFYEALIKGLELPSWCGKDPDAIWDLLTGHMEYPAVIHIWGINSLPDDLHYDKELILKVFDDVVKEYPRLNYSFDFID